MAENPSPPGMEPAALSLELVQSSNPPLGIFQSYLGEKYSYSDYLCLHERGG